MENSRQWKMVAKWWTLVQEHRRNSSIGKRKRRITKKSITWCLIYAFGTIASSWFLLHSLFYTDGPFFCVCVNAGSIQNVTEFIGTHKKLYIFHNSSLLLWFFFRSRLISTHFWFHLSAVDGFSIDQNAQYDFFYLLYVFVVFTFFFLVQVLHFVEASMCKYIREK